MKAEIREKLNAAQADAARHAGVLPETDIAVAEAPAESIHAAVDELAELDRQLEREKRELELEDLREKRDKRRAEAENIRRLRLANISRIAEERALKSRAQELCRHVKENGRPNIGGQKLSNGHLSLVCQTCHREFDETNLPPHLMISLDNIGG